MSFSLKQHSLLRESRRPLAYSVSFPDPTVLTGVREDMAVGMVANVAIGDNVIVRNDFDRVPIFQRPIFNATWDGGKGRWVDFVARGEPGFTYHPSDPYREVIYRCQPFWYQIELREGTGPARVSVSPYPLEGYTLAPMFPNERDYIYRPVFEMSVGKDNLPHSRSNQWAFRGKGLSEIMQYVAAYDPRARVESVFDWFSDALLLLVEFATWDLASYMRGNFTREVTTGLGVTHTIASSGCLLDGAPIVWRGKENAWQNVCSFLCDILIQKHIAADGSYTTTICHLPDLKYFDGTINEHYVEIAPYFSNIIRGQFPVGGFDMKKGVFYPSSGITGDTAIKSYAYIQSQLGEEFPIVVGVGGGTSSQMLPADVNGSPFHWEAVQKEQSREQNFGARLILDEAL
ncbi:MAG: hypothetical protein E7585_04425 [Ruminococcaceae bacterium]|nr:hypothetical protein [Oscillospiraceae bacterium]